MPQYDFKSLSPVDFEGLVRDLMQAEMRIRLESFTVGRDSGIDFRHAWQVDGVSKKLIVQCKHFGSSGVQKLIRNLAKEVAKINKLKPHRYIIATSVGLTPGNKDDILVMFTPYCISTDDVFGLDDLNNLLGRHSEIERATYKLWMTSQHVLERVLHNDLFIQTDLDIVAIRRKMSRYVQNDAYPRAKRALDELNYCIISGVPGIGKTTLADALLVQYLMNGYEVVTVRQNIDEAFRAFKKECKQIFYYDDFLGQTVIGDRLGKNEDKNIIRMIDAIRKDPEKKFLLTTREYILAQAKQDHELLANSAIELGKSIIQLNDYTRQHRARILYNHVFFSDLPKAYVEALLSKRAYLRVVDHGNFSPRIIEWLTDLDRLEQAGIRADKYRAFLLQSLEDPSRLWAHAFLKHITTGSRHLLEVMATMPNEILQEDLRPAFNALQELRKRKYNTSYSEFDFDASLNETEGTFLRIEKTSFGALLAFHNPSVIDFLAQFLIQHPDQLLELLETATSFEQLQRITALYVQRGAVKETSIAPVWVHAATRLGKARPVLMSPTHHRGKKAGWMMHSLDYASRIAWLLDAVAELSMESPRPVCIRIINSFFSKLPAEAPPIDSLNDLLKRLNESNWIPSACFTGCLTASREYLLNANDRQDFWSLDDFCAAGRILTEYQAPKRKQIAEFAEITREFIEREAKSLVYDEETADNLREEANRIELLAARFSLDVEDELAELRERADELEVEAEARYHEDEEKYSFGATQSTEISDSAVEEMFKSLSEE